MQNIHESGKIYFFKTGLSEDPSNTFGSLLEVNSNFDILKSLHICGGKALGITSNNELLEWEFDSKQSQKSNPSIPSPLSSINLTKSKSKTIKKNDFYFLLFKPSYHFHKIKFISINLNKTMCLGLDTSGNVLVWGQNNEGLLGLGYDINSVETPTILTKLKDIKEISLSDYHAVVLNNNGNAFSWGLGKYGELGLERTIYTPTPQQILTDTIYTHVFCGNLITCFLDGNGHFYYFGVVIKQLGGYSNTITLKSLLNDQTYQDGKNIYFEKEIEELENENFKNIVIGNGFVALLSKNGLLYVLEYNNKLSMLYSKFFLYNITVSYNEIYGLARERPKIEKIKNFKDNYYLCRWNSKCSSENDLYSDIWSTTIWKFKDDFQLISTCKLLESNNNRSLLLLKDEDEKYNLTNSIFNPHRKNLEMSGNNDTSLLDNSVNNQNMTALGDMIINHQKKILPEKFLEYNSQYDDSYNIKYKRCKIKLNVRTGIDTSNSYINNKSKNMTHIFKTSQNNIFNKINSSLSPFNDNNISNNNLQSGSFNVHFDNGKENDNVNIYRPEDEDLVDIKEKELDKYRNEVDNIINNFKIKKDSMNITGNSINNSKNDVVYTGKGKNERNNNKISENKTGSNQNERYSFNQFRSGKKANDDYDDYENNPLDIDVDDYDNKGKNKKKLHLTKEEMIKYYSQTDKKGNKNKKKKNKKEFNSNYNDALSRIRDNIIPKNKIKYKNDLFNRINNSLILIEEEEKDENRNIIKGGKKKKKFQRSASFSNLKSKNYRKKKKGGENGENSSSDFVDYEDLKENKIKRNNSLDNILLDKKHDSEGDDDSNNDYNINENNIGQNYIDTDNNDTYRKNKKGRNKKGINSKNGNYNQDNSDDDDNYEYDGNNETKKLRSMNKSKKFKNNKNNINGENEYEDGDGDNNNNYNNGKNKSNNKKRKNRNNNINGDENEEEEDEENLDGDIRNNKTGKKNTNKNNKNNNRNEDGDIDNSQDENDENNKLKSKKKILKNRQNNNFEDEQNEGSGDENNFNSNNKKTNKNKQRNKNGQNLDENDNEEIYDENNKRIGKNKQKNKINNDNNIEDGEEIYDENNNKIINKKNKKGRIGNDNQEEEEEKKEIMVKIKIKKK